MVKFLVKRPIAVIMTTIAFVVLGLTSMFELPVSLMPDVDIPEVNIYLQKRNASAKEIESGFISQIRERIQDIDNLRDIETQSFDEKGNVKLKFDYGTSIDKAFMSVNEKIDNIMNSFYSDVKRPMIIKASASDIPVFYLNINFKNSNSEKDFLDLSEFTESVIKRRIEQLQDVAMVDVTGYAKPEIQITPDLEKLESLHISTEDLSNAIKDNNKISGSLWIKDGYYRFNIKFQSQLLNKKDIEDVYLNINGRLLQIKDVAIVRYTESESLGSFYNKNKRGISMAIIKQSNARMSDLKNEVAKIVEKFKLDYPNIDFSVSRDQALLLDYSITNLLQSLIAGIILAILTMFFFLKDARSPFIIGISVPISLIISLLFFKFLNISINTVSLSGLILGVGMMIDNSIIVIDNINQFISRGSSLFNACVKATSEVIRPLLSSVLTTCAVFIPLIFLKGISGALFYDQAMAVTIGLFVSLFVSITIVPVIFNLVSKKAKETKLDRFINRISFKNPERLYERVYDYLFEKRRIFLISCVVFLGIGFFIFLFSKVESMPKITSPELIVKLGWNESIELKENQKRVSEIVKEFGNKFEEFNAYIGEKDFLLEKDNSANVEETELYVRASDENVLNKIVKNIFSWVNTKYPNANIERLKVKNIFEQMFSNDEASIVANLLTSGSVEISPDVVSSLSDSIKMKFPNVVIYQPSLLSRVILKLKSDNVCLYNVNVKVLLSDLKKEINSIKIDELRCSNDYIPIVFAGKKNNLFHIINSCYYTCRDNSKIPFSALINVESSIDYKAIEGRKYGKIVPIKIYNTNENEEEIVEYIREYSNSKDINVLFTGGFFSGLLMLHEMIIVLIVSVLMLYFILASQFESLKLPFIVLLEIPIDIALVLIVLFLCGLTINLMSMIGLIVMCGIIINDSILKIDTINKLRQEGYKLKEAIHLGGVRRFKPIIMTSLTTILAMFPFIWGNDLGSQLQKPLAVTIISGMTIGTFVSLFFIPLCYYYFERKRN